MTPDGFIPDDEMVERERAEHQARLSVTESARWVNYAQAFQHMMFGGAGLLLAGVAAIIIGDWFR